MRERVFHNRAQPILKKDQTFKILSWNIQFMAGNEDNYFVIDGGSDTFNPQKPEEMAKKNAQTIIECVPDFILLQEVNHRCKFFQSKCGKFEKIHLEDQLQRLLFLLPNHYINYTSTPYVHTFVPPLYFAGFFGRLSLKMAIISKYKISSTACHALPINRRYSPFERPFRAKRSVFGIKVPIENSSKHVSIYTTHLTQKAEGSITIKKQLEVCENILKGKNKSKTPAIIAGDFNLDLPIYGSEMGSDIINMFKISQSFPSIQPQSSAAQFYTYMETSKPGYELTNTYDYAFATQALPITKGQLIDNKGIRQISDHLPLLITCKVTL